MGEVVFGKVAVVLFGFFEKTCGLVGLLKLVCDVVFIKALAVLF